MSLPPISYVAWFLYQYPNLKEYLQQKKVDLQQIENIEVAGRHMTALLLDGITIGGATVTLTMQNRQQQFFTVSAKEVQKLLTPLQRSLHLALVPAKIFPTQLAWQYV